MDVDFGLIQFNGALIEINAYNLSCDGLGWVHTSLIEYVTLRLSEISHTSNMSKCFLRGKHPEDLKLFR